MVRILFHAVVILALTALTQLGGIAWLVSLAFRWRLPAFLVAYAALSALAVWTAPVFGRVPLSCAGDGPLRVQGWLYCALNRNYVAPELAAALADAATEMDRRFPGTETLVLDANFPFLAGFPLLPHLSHDDGRKADLAFYYQDEGGYLPGATRSPIGYFAFEEGAEACPVSGWLRWDLRWLQPFWPSYGFDEVRTRHLLATLAADGRIGKLLIEPHLRTRLGLPGGKIRFQGCHAARHDDHVHVQL